MTGMPPNLLSSAQSLAGQDYVSAGDAGLASSGTDTPSSRLRKTSSIPYHSPGFRPENKERPSQRIGKALIIVIPPPTLLQEHGHELSNGPFHRLSHGVVMPLLPSV